MRRILKQLNEVVGVKGDVDVSYRAEKLDEIHTTANCYASGEDAALSELVE